MLQWFTSNAAAIAAIASVASAVFTALYLIATVLIFREARRSADAAIEAARSGKENAGAAKQSASAAEGSANAAMQTVALMRQQMEEQADLGRSIIKATVDTATTTIDHWRALKIPSLPVNRIPNTDDLVPSRADSAVEHARRVSQEAAMKLSSAFDDLRNARRELETLRNTQHPHMKAEAFQPTCRNFEGFLNSALEKLMTVRALVL